MASKHHSPLNRQVIVITGASSGIGLATAHAAAKAGAKLVLTARSADTLKAIVDELSKSYGCEAIAVPADVADRQQVERVADTAMVRFGRIDTWVNDAGVSIYGRIEEPSESDNRRLFDTNFWGVVNGSLVVLPYLRKTAARSSTSAAKCRTRWCRCRACTAHRSTRSRASPMPCASRWKSSTTRRSASR